MLNISPQQYYAKGARLGIDQETLNNARNSIIKIQGINPSLYPLLTLNHLAVQCGLPYYYLRSIVERKLDEYKHFHLKKRLPGRNNKRLISVPSSDLLRCQKWITANILSVVPTHDCSYAYAPNSSPVFAAQVHTQSSWMVKVDIQDFFTSVSEHRVYQVFRSLGYSKLLSLELSRICTAVHNSKCNPDKLVKYGKNSIQKYQNPHSGFLPQGAPTSPMLSNLVVRELDNDLQQLSKNVNMRFTRYADDIVFSCTEKREYGDIISVKDKMLHLINKNGFQPNQRKTVIRGPGKRKIVLGMLVDGSHPRLPKEYKDMLRLHLYYLSHSNFGPSIHADARSTSVSKMFHYVRGMIFWSISVEPEYGEKLLAQFNAIDWPPIDWPETVEE